MKYGIFWTIAAIAFIGIVANTNPDKPKLKLDSEEYIINELKKDYLTPEARASWNKELYKLRAERHERGEGPEPITIVEDNNK